MRKQKYWTWLLGVSVLGLLASPASAAFGDVVASFRAPAAEPMALAWADGQLYCYCNTGQYRIWKINPSTGNAVGSFVFTDTGKETGGLAHDGRYFWAGNNAENRIYRFEWRGSAVSSFKPGWNVARGLAWSGFHLWGTQEGGTWAYRFYQMRFDGKVVRSFISYYVLYDLAWDGRYLWTPEYDRVGQRTRIVALNVAKGGLVAAFTPPADNPRGATFDGTYLWVSTLADNGWLWKIDIQGVSVEPASLGRVKALFH
jgi:hypothetical protein